MYFIFHRPSSYSGLSEISLSCRNGELQGASYYSNNFYFECDVAKWDLYEALAPFSWCPSPMESYLYAQPSSKGSHYNILAAICYSFDDLSIQAVHYTMTTRSWKYLVSSMNNMI